MATISFTLPDAAAAELVDALCELFMYQPLLGDGSPNPETRAQFARRMTKEWMISQVRLYRRRLAEGAANPSPLEIT